MSGGRPLVTLAAAGAGFVILLGVSMATTPAPAARPDASASVSASPSGAPTAPATAAATDVPATEPAGPAFPAEAVYVGRAADGRTTIAVAVWNGKAAAYICDGRSVESWLTGTVTGGTAQLAGSNSTLTASKTAAGIAAEFTVGGRGYTAAAAPASKPAGLYRGRAGRTTVGWIVLPDGTQVGLASGGGLPTPAPSLTPGRPAEVGGTPVTGEEIRGDERF